MRYDWPGNVRDLENTIERAAVLSRQEAIEPGDLPVQGLMRLERRSLRPDRQLYTHAANRCSSTYEVARLLGVSQPTSHRELRKYRVLRER